MYSGELKEKDKSNLKYSDGHYSGGIRAIDMALNELQKDGTIDAAKKNRLRDILLDQWEEFNRFGLQEEE